MKFRNIILISLLLISAKNADATNLHIVIDSNVGGAKYIQGITKADYDFVRDGSLLSTSTNLVKSETILKNASSGFSNPIEPIMLTLALQKEGEFNTLRKLLLNDSQTEDQKSQFSDKVLNESQKNLKDITDIEPLVIFESSDKKGVWVFYHLTGNGLKYTYCDFVKKVGPNYFPSIGDTNNDKSATLFLFALVDEVNLKVKKYSVSNE